MIFLFLTGGVGGPPLVDPEDATEYYRQYLDDPEVMVLTARHVLTLPVTPTEDLDYLRRYLDDVLV